MTIEYVVIGCYLLLMLGIGAIFGRMNKNASDYFRAGCRGTWWLVGSSILMSSVSVYTFVGNAGLAYEGGWSVIAVYLINIACFAVNAMWLAGWFRQLRIITFPEAIRERFGPKLQQFYSYYNVVTLLLHASIQLWSLSMFANALFDIPVGMTILLLGGVLIFYSTVGGSWAVMATDFVQSLLLMSITIALTVFCLYEVGGIDGLFKLIESQGLQEEFSIISPAEGDGWGKFSWGWVAGLLLIQVSANCGLQNATRFFAVKDGREAKKAACLTMVLMAVGATCWFIPPIVARLLFSEDVVAVAINNPAESAFAIASLKLLPAGLIGLMMVAMTAASMSTLDSALNWNAAIFIRNILPPIAGKFGWEFSECFTLRLSRIFTMLFGAIMISLAFYFSSLGGKGAFDMVFSLNAMLMLPLMLPLLLSLFVRRVPAWSGIVTVVFGLMPTLIAKLLGYDWEAHISALCNFTVGTIAFFICSFFWSTASEAYRQQVDQFFEKMHRPVDFEVEVGDANDSKQMKILGCISLVIGLFVLILVVLPNEWSDRVAILSISAAISAVGCALWFVGRRRSSASS
ncbi:sodium:solute symporter family protein [Coraliomargarita sp. W4R53]